MKKGRVMSIRVITLAGLLAVGPWVYGQTQMASVLTAQDAHEITHLYATMYQGSDFRDAELWLSTFSDDGVFIFPTGDEVTGKQALAEWREKSFGGQTGDSKRRHYFPNIRMVQTPDGGATARAYWVELDVSGQPAAIRNTGTADDVFVKTSAGWKFKSHAVHLDATTN